MKSRKGFTLIELMVVVLIVAILAAVAIPILRGRIDAAKWSEGKAVMGSIATAIRAYAGEHGDADWSFAAGTSPIGMAPGDLQAFVANDLTGTYFSDGDFVFTAAYVASTNALTFTITCTAGGGGGSGNPPAAPPGYTLDEQGTFTAQ